MSTRMSRFTRMAAVFVAAGSLAGCVGTDWSWRGRPRDTVQAATLPIVPSPRESQSYADAASQPRYVQQSAGAGGGCSNGSCCSRGGSCGNGSCCSSGSCRTGLAAAPRGAPDGQVFGGATSENQMAQQNTPAPAAGGYGGQKTCPVTGEALGSMGPPIPVSMKGQTIYVCCEGCVKAVQGDPDQYIAKVIHERSGQ